MIFDGMPADYITPTLMPEQWVFRESASRAERLMKALAFVDAWFGRIIRPLESASLRNNT